MRTIILASLIAFLADQPSWAASDGNRQAVSQALELAETAIALRSVAGPGNRTPEVAALFRDTLVKNGFPAAQAVITRHGETAYLIARWPGSDPKLKPLVILGHMDVVEAKPADWTRDPFKPAVEGGYLFGRGSTDMKLDDAIAIAALGELKRTGYQPRRDIVVALSGDEETEMATGAILGEQLSNAEVALNMDGSGGRFDEITGAPKYFTWQAAEKTYADYHLSVTNPGGHSSEPRATNAIDEFATALLKTKAYHFKPELSELSTAYFQKAASQERPNIAAAMRAFAKDPTSPDAVATLSAEPSLVGKIGTTCEVTMISGGHALNALPQRAEANINCRIFPGHPRPEIMSELESVAADPAIHIEDVTIGSVETPASPLRPDVAKAIEAAIAVTYPGTPVFPSMGSGTSDSQFSAMKVSRVTG